MHSVDSQPPMTREEALRILEALSSPQAEAAFETARSRSAAFVEQLRAAETITESDRSLRVTL